MVESAAATAEAASGPVVFRAWAVDNAEIIGVPIEELKGGWDGFSWVRVRRDGQDLRPMDAGSLRRGDEFLALGDVRFMCRIQDIGKEITGQYLEEARSDRAQVVIGSPKVAGRTLSELNIPGNYGVYVERVWRTGKPIPREVDTTLLKGDVLDVVGPPPHLDDLGRAFGSIERPSFETDMFTLCIAIAVGVVLGTLSITVAGTPLGLGSAGGLLLAGILVGFGRSLRPGFGRLPEGARWFLVEFGLLIFMLGVGLRAGGSILEALASSGPALITAGVCVTLVPLTVGLLVALKVLQLNPAVAFGAITGAMTSGAALSVVTTEAKSGVPALGYTGTYAFANVLLTVAGTLVLVLA